MKKAIMWLLMAYGAHSAEAAQAPRSIDVVIEETSPAAGSCGVSQTALNALAVTTLRDNGIEVVRNSNVPFLYIVPTVARESNLCSAYLMVSIRQLVHLPPIAGFTVREGGPGMAVLCESGDLSTSVGGTLDVSGTLRQRIKNCLEKLDY